MHIQCDVAQAKHLATRLPLYVKHLSAYHQPEGGNTEVGFVFTKSHSLLQLSLVFIALSLKVINGASYTLLVPTPTRTLR